MESTRKRRRVAKKSEPKRKRRKGTDERNDSDSAPVDSDSSLDEQLEQKRLKIPNLTPLNVKTILRVRLH